MSTIDLRGYSFLDSLQPQFASFLATVAQTAVGSFTGGLLNPIATELANKAVDKWFNIDPGTADQYQIDDD